MSYQFIFILLGILLFVFGLAQGGWFLLGAWLGLNFLILGVAHGRGSHRIFGKRADGTLPLWSWLVFLPLLSYTSLVWHLIRLSSREPAQNAVTKELVIGRRLLASELDGEFENFVDLTAEFSEPLPLRSFPSYRSFPILDGSAPTPEALRSAVKSLKPGRTFIHCAQGHGRTGLFSLAVLLSLGVVRSVEDGIRMLSAARPAIRLSRQQHRCIQAYHDQQFNGNTAKVEFEPRWKEELVGTMDGNRFVIEMTMGKLTVFLPGAAKWEAEAPDWAKHQWERVRAELSEWCRFKRIPLVIEDDAWVLFD